ncbi:MAG: hypothetical protein WBB85_00790 [Albidovulum sp.]|uniref:hypothetical protein n=1 Tax=Albidovulum sp. TaxID=1872424 RepID=UPI003C986895
MPFLLLSLLSPAVMPSRGVDGTVALVLCTGDGPVTLAFDPVTGAPVEHDPDGVSERCDWAASHHAVIDLARPELRAIAGAVTPGKTPPVPQLLAATRATGLPPATGPPSAA